MAVNKGKPVRRGNDSRLIRLIQRHKSALIASLISLLQTPFASAISVTVMAIAITLSGSFYVLVSNAQQLVNTLQTGKQMSLFLHERISDQDASKLAQKLRANEAIENVTVISKQQALVEFQQYSGFGAALGALESNPLPAVIQVFPKKAVTDKYQLKQLLGQMQNQQAVDFVQMDMDWVARLQSIMQIARKVVLLLSTLLALAVIFITGNTVRSELQTRHDEVVVTMLVGGTNAFIRLPFLYAGFWYGFLSGVLAWGIIFIMLKMISAPIEQLSMLYQSQFQLNLMTIGESALLVFGSSVLAITGAFIVASQQLSLLKPK